jgi:hypothetical protein
LFSRSCSLCKASWKNTFKTTLRNCTYYWNLKLSKVCSLLFWSLNGDINVINSTGITHCAKASIILPCISLHIHHIKKCFTQQLQTSMKSILWAMYRFLVEGDDFEKYDKAQFNLPAK